MVKQSRPLVIALVGLVLLCLACGGVESYSSVSTMDNQSLVSVVSSGVYALQDKKSYTKSSLPGVMDRRPIAYLDEIIPPCLPLEGSEQNPCSPIILSPIELPIGASPPTSLHSVPSFVEMLSAYGFSTAVPHIVVRGTVHHDTTRCDLYPLAWFNHYQDYNAEFMLEENAFYYCFAEVRINEYIVGEGPLILTVLFYTKLVDRPGLGEMPVITEQEELEAYSRVSKYEGKELVLFLGIPWTRAVEVWEVSPLLRNLWLVQNNGDVVRAVAEHITMTTDQKLREHMDLPLDELVRQIREASEERYTLTGGRIGVDRSLPMLVTDANKLQDFYQNTGAVYEGENATVLPPPVPGGEEPEQPPTRTGGEQPDATTIPAPGDESSPTTTDDASPPASSTTTTLPQVEDTSTTTTVAASTSTTLPQAKDTLPTTTTTAAPSDDDTTGTTQPQVEEPASTTTSTTAAPSDDDTTGTNLPQVEDPVPTTTGTTAGPAPSPTSSVRPPRDGEPGEPTTEDPDSAPAGTAPPPPDDETGAPAGGDGPGVDTG